MKVSNHEWRPEVCLLALVVLCLPAGAAAQAWLPHAGEGTVSVTYQGLYSRDHLDLNGAPFDKGRVTSHLLLVGIEYGLTDRLTIDARVGAVSRKHAGVDAFHGPLDNGRYHGAIQDVRVGLAWQMTDARAVAIAPFVAVILPTHEYETRGHSAPGRRLRTLQVGAWVGRSFGRGYLQAQGAYALVERVVGMSTNRTLLDAEVGYPLWRPVTARMTTTLHRTHGGVTWPLSPHLDDHVRHDHDRVSRDNFAVMSGGVSVAVSRGTSIYGTVIRTLSGQNTHKVLGGTVGVAWSFGRIVSFGSD